MAIDTCGGTDVLTELTGMGFTSLEKTFRRKVMLSAQT
jgi:hypothetical protein